MHSCYVVGCILSLFVSCYLVDGGGGGGELTRMENEMIETNVETTTVDFTTDYDDIISTFTSSGSGDILEFSSPSEWEWHDNIITATTTENVSYS